MARRGKQILSAVCALALLCALVLPRGQGGHAHHLPDGGERPDAHAPPWTPCPPGWAGCSMCPIWHSTGRSPGSTWGCPTGRSTPRALTPFTLYSLRGTLVFDLNAGTCVDQLNGTSLDMRAVQRNGRVFLPLAGVCSFFGLNYTYTPTQYGTLIRITNGQEWLSTQDFVSTASGDAMRTRYYEYLRQLEGDSQETSTPQTPGESTGGETEQEGLPVYLAVQCTGAGGLESILDSLGDRGARAPVPLPGGGPGRFRRPAAAAGGHRPRRGPVGVRRLPGDGPGRAGGGVPPCWRSWPTCGPTPSIWRTPPPAWPTPWRRRAGCAGRPMWTPIDIRTTALLQNLEGRRSTARVLLDDSTACASMLERALPRMSRSDYQFRLALETRI